MNVLNKVEVKNTFRINATSALEAATIAAPARREITSVKPVLNQEGVFIALSTIGSSTYHDVVFVELVSTGKYRVEVGSENLSEIEYTWLIGGDEAVNECGHFAIKVGTSTPRNMTKLALDKEIAHWADFDAKSEEADSNMVGYIKAHLTEYKFVNGKLEEVK